MPRPSWSGSIRLSLVNVPVEGYTAAESSEAPVSFNQLHDECHSRIRYLKTCPIHGPVENHEIVKGYKYGPDQYAIVEPEEINKLRSEADRAVAIDKFVPQGSVDPIYFSGQTYYLIPKGRQAQKPYAVLHRAIVEEKVWGLAQVVISNREQLVVLRPIDQLLAISILSYANEVRSSEMFARDLENEKPSAQEVKLAKTLIDMSSAKAPDLGKYRDLYNDRLTKLVQAKIKGEDVATVPDDDERPAVFDFMAALKASLKEKKPRTPGSKPLYRTSRTRKATTRRRKSG